MTDIRSYLEGFFQCIDGPEHDDAWVRHNHWTDMDTCNIVLACTKCGRPEITTTRGGCGVDP